MAGKTCFLAIDQGTTSSRVIAFSTEGNIVASHQLAFEQHFPHPGWVEHDAEQIFAGVLICLGEVLDRLEASGHQALAIGITNQRETVVAWDRATGKPLHKAIVWQDRRTSEFCSNLRDAGHEPMIQARTGLLLDPYFSASKMRWMIDNVDGLRERLATGSACLGTIDSYLLFRLTGGAFMSDATNASRTMLFDIRAGKWDGELLELFGVPLTALPEVVDCAGEFGVTDPAVIGRAIPITGMAGDQQAAAIGQACLTPGSIKSTYGTGCFLLYNTGRDLLPSTNRLLSTIACQLDGTRTFALEGSIFMAGAAVQWLRDGLGIIDAVEDSEALAASLDDNRGVYVVPAFVGLGAPHWDAEARGTITGLTRDSGPAHLARAVLEAVAYQTHDLLQAAIEDGAPRPEVVRVDGGMVANDWLMGFLADILDTRIDRPRIIETTALGAAYLAGLGHGHYESLDEIAEFWSLDRRFEPEMSESERAFLVNGWSIAVKKTLSTG